MNGGSNTIITYP